MASDDLCWMPATALAAAIKRKKLSPVELMRAVLARIEKLNPTLNAFVTLTAGGNDLLSLLSAPAADMAPALEKIHVRLRKIVDDLLGRGSRGPRPGPLDA